MKLVNKIKLIVLFAVMLVVSLCAAACSGDKNKVDIPDYPSNVEEQPNTYTDLHDNTVVTIDGTITDAEWAGQNKWEETINISGYDHHIEIWSRFAEAGVVMAYRVTGAPAYYDAGRGSYANSGIEIYIANGKATNPVGNQWEMEFFANGDYHTSKYIKFNGNSNYAGSNAYIDLAGRWLDQNGNTTYTNDPDNNGYEDEVMIPWYIIGGKTDSIVFNAAIQYMASATSTTRSGYINILEVVEGSNYWTSCQNWRRFDKDGYYDKSKAKFSVTPYDVGAKAYNDGYAFTEHGWNTGNSQLCYNTPVAAGEDYILTAKLYAPHLAHEEGSDGWNENYANETNYLPQGQGGTETAYNGFSATKNGQKVELAFQKGWGADGVFFRWNGNDWGWTNVKLSSVQLEKYMTEGLKVGMYVKGNVVTPLLENDAGELVVLDGAMVKTVAAWATAGETKLAVYYQCDTKFDQWNVYTGDAINGSLTVIDETAADEHGSITATGKMFDSVTVNVTPEEGYELASLLIDGVEYAARVENNAVTEKVTGTKVTVKATFRAAINQSITLNVTRKFAYETKGYSADGAEVILTDAEGNTYTGLVKDGQVTIKVVDGTYTLTANGYANATLVTVEGGQASLTEVALLRKMFNDVDNTVTAVLTGDGTSETGATLKTTEKANVNKALDNKQWKLEKNIDFSGKVVLIYTLGMGSERQTYATIETNRSLNTINQGHWNDTTGYYDAPNNDWNVSVKHSEPTTFMAIFEGQSSIQLYYKVNGVWTLLSNFNDKNEGDLTALTFTQGEHSAIITWSDIKVYDGERADEILKNTATLTYDNAVVDATISKTTGIEKGEEITVTASVKDSSTHQIASVTVNGAALTAGEDGTYKFTATGYMGNYNVVVTAETLAAELTFTTTHKFAYETNYYNLPDGTELSFVNGDIVKNATVANGRVTVALSNGTYTVNGLSVVVTNGAVESTSLQWTRELVKTSTNVTITANNETGLSYTNEPDASLTIADVDMTNNVLVFDIRAQYDGDSVWADLLVEPYAWNSVDLAKTYPNNSSITKDVGYRVDWCPNQYGSQFQLGGNKNGDHAVRTTKYWTTVLLRTVITDGTAKTEIYIGNFDGTFSLFGELGKNNADASAMFYKFSHAAGASNEVKNVKIYDGERATAYFNALTKVEASNATVDGVTLTGTRYADLTKYESEKSIVVYGIGSNGAGCNAFSISSGEKIVAMTYDMQILDKTFVGTKDADGAWMTFDKTEGAEIVHQMNGWLGYRFRDGNWSTQAFADNYKTAVYEEGGVNFALAISGGTGRYFVKGTDGLMYNSKSYAYAANNTPTTITGIKSAVALKLTNVKFYTQAQWEAYLTETANANIDVTESENGSASVDYHFAGNTVVTVTPDEGYILDTLKVNGVDVTANVSENTYTAENYNKLGIKVEATFKLKPATTYNVTLTVKVHNTAKTASALTGEATLTGASGTYTATAANGVLNFGKVVEGEYKLQIAGYTETTIVVDKAVNSELELYFVTSGATTVKTEANDAVYTLNNKSDKITLPAGTKAVSFRVKVVNYTVASNADNCGLHITSDTGERNGTPELWLKAGTYKVRTCWGENAPFTNYQLAKLTGDGLFINLEIKDGKIYYYVESYDGTLMPMVSAAPDNNAAVTEFRTIALVDITGGVVISELSAYATVDNGKVVVEEIANGTIASDKTALKNGETATVTVTPNDGYKVAGVKVNGEYVTATVNEAGVATVTIKGQYGMYYYVTAVLTADAGTAHTFTVAHGYAYETAYALADGTVVTFVSESGIYQGVVKGDKLTVTAPAGTYTAVLAGHASLSVELTETAEEGTLTLIRTIIKDTSATDLTAVDNGKDGATVSNKNNKLENPPKSYIQIGDRISGKTVYTMTLKVPSLGWGSCPRLWFFDEANTYTYKDISNIVNIIIAGSIEFRPANGTTTLSVASTSVDILVIVEGTKINVYVKASSNAEYVHVNAKDGATDYTLNLPSNVKFMAIGATDGFKTWDMASIKAYDGERAEKALAITASVDADSSEQANVVLSKTTGIEKGEEVTATVTLKDSENYHILSVSVNGTELTGEEGVYKFNANSYATNYAVKVVTEATAHDVAVTAQYKYAYENELYNMADGTELTFTSGDISKTATVKDGKFTISLSNGTYTVSGDHIKSSALVVTDEITTAKFEAQRLTLVATDESKMTITEDENGATVTFNGKTFKSAYALLPTISGKTVIKGTYVGAGTWDDSLDFLNADKTQNDYLLNIGSGSSEGNYTVDLKWLNASDTTTGTANKDSGVYQVKFAIVVDGNNITGYSSVLKADGTWEEYKTKTDLTAKTLLFGFASGGTGACSFKNVTIAALTGDFNPND